MAENQSGISPTITDKPVERRKSKATITDDMMLKAVTMANEIDKKESKMNMLQNGIKNFDAGDEEMNPNESMTLNNVTGTDSNGNEKFQENCPFDIVCDFLQAIMQKKYEEALNLCKTILVHEPQNQIANEFRNVLQQMVGESGSTENVTQKPGQDGDMNEDDESESNLSESESELESTEGMSSSDDEEIDEENLSEGGGDGNNKLLKFFTSDNESESSSSSESEEESDEDEEDSSSSSSSSSEESSQESESESHVESSRDLSPQSEGDYDFGESDAEEESHEDDTFDMITSLDYELEDNSYVGTQIEDLGPIENEPKPDQSESPNNTLQ